jgi:hypothetical protein
MNTQLNKTPNEIQNLYNTKPTWANDFRKHLKKKYLELQLVMSDTYAPELVWNAELNDYKPVKATTMKWFWKSRGQDFAWIPIEYIP